MKEKTELQNNSISIVLFLLMCIIGSNSLNAQAVNSDLSSFKVSSTAFVDQGDYPKLYTCDSLAYSPPLVFKNVPKSAEMLAITMSHIAKDGEQHVYWVVYNIPVNSLQIPQNERNIGWFGHNTMNKNLAYSPPCSKGPGEKKYTITTYAVSKKVSDKGLTMKELLEQIQTTILATSELTVKYSR